jgi:hypothetical protein
MTIVIDDNLLAIWWIKLPPASDLLCSLIRRSPTECEIVYRFRYYETESAWDGLDRKNWYEGIVTAPPEEVIPKLREMFGVLSVAAGGSKVYELLRGERSTDQFMRAFARMPFVHMKEGEELKKWEKEYEQRKAPYRAPLPLHYSPDGGDKAACPIEVIGTNITTEPGDVTCKRCAKHRAVVEYRNNLREKQRPPHA